MGLLQLNAAHALLCMRSRQSMEVVMDAMVGVICALVLRTQSVLRVHKALT